MTENTTATWQGASLGVSSGRRSFGVGEQARPLPETSASWTAGGFDPLTSPLSHVQRGGHTPDPPAERKPAPPEVREPRPRAPRSSSTRVNDAELAWARLQNRFVEDPEGAVREAVELVQSTVSELGTPEPGADTEHLRQVFLMLRELHSRLAR